MQMSHICKRRGVHLGLDLGRAGDFPGAGGDGSLLAGGAGPVAAGVLDATAGTSGVLPAHVFMVLTLPVFPLRPVPGPAPPAQAPGAGVRPRPLPVHVGGGFLRLLLGPPALLVALAGPPAFVSALCDPPSCILLSVPPVLRFSRGSAGLLASWTPGALGLLQVLQRHGRVLFSLGALPGASISLPLGFPLLVHIFQGAAVASLCLPRALGALRVVPPAVSGSLGAGGLGVAPARLSGLGAAGAGGALMVVVVRELLLSSCSGSLPAARGPGGPGVGELIRDDGHFRRRRGQFRGREGDGGWRGWR